MRFNSIEDLLRGEAFIKQINRWKRQHKRSDTVNKKKGWMNNVA